MRIEPDDNLGGCFFVSFSSNYVGVFWPFILQCHFEVMRYSCYIYENEIFQIVLLQLSLFSMAIRRMKRYGNVASLVAFFMYVVFCWLWNAQCSTLFKLLYAQSYETWYIGPL